ncbi:MAG: hypothetical protein ACR2IE_05165 [Candidatus Sumerlaeaceae bacterium]
MQKFLLAIPVVLLASSGFSQCCTTLDPTPTLSNGGCASSSYNCKPYPKYACDGPRLKNRATTNCFSEWFNTNTGTWALYNSVGKVLGTFLGGAGHVNNVRVQTGVRAVDTNLGMLMAWSVATNNGTFTGWLNTQAMAQSTSGNYDTQPNYPGGDVSLWHMVVSDNSIYLDGNGDSFKVNTDCDTAGENATDYLTRSNGLNNMIYNLPGNGYGSVTVGNRLGATPYNFYRYTAVTSVDRALWNCRTSSYSSRVLKFLFGRMWEKQIARDGSSVIMSRRGWVAIDCLDPGVGTQDY